MVEVKVTNCGCVVFDDGNETCTAEVDLTVQEAFSLVRSLSMDLESAEFDLRCSEFFNSICEDM